MTSSADLINAYGDVRARIDFLNTKLLGTPLASILEAISVEPKIFQFINDMHKSEFMCAIAVKSLPTNSKHVPPYITYGDVNLDIK